MGSTASTAAKDNPLVLHDASAAILFLWQKC